MFLSVLTAATPVAAELSTATSTIQEYNQDGSPLGSPGITGFLVTMVLGIVIILLGLDLTRRQRRLRYRVDYAKAREAELNGETSAQSSEHDAQDASVKPSAGAARSTTQDGATGSSRRAEKR